MTGRKKLIITVIFSVLLVMLYIMIFHFSAQDGDTSSNLSQGITKRFVSWIRFFSKGNVSDHTQKFISSGEFLLRKGAHFSEYAVMGILTFGILNCYIRKGKAYLFAVIWVILSAALDEWHQYFIPGRCARVFDVMIDTLGGMTGAAIFVLFIYMIEKNRMKKRLATLKQVGYSEIMSL